MHFTWRGGEGGNPDVVAPGAAASSTPMHARGENMWGTSRDCPQAAGAAAVLISACQQENIPWNGALIKRALTNSAVPLPGYTPLDQGDGVINIPRAFEIMKTFADRDEIHKVLDYTAETTCPQYNDGKGQNAYWRAGGYFPTDKKQVFNVTAIFPKDATADDRANFYRSFNLKCDQPWFRLDKSSTYIRGEHSAKIGGWYNADLLKKPGLYVAKISAFAKSGAGKNTPDFELLNTVIVPYRFDASNHYQLKIKNKRLKSGQYHRYFVQVPPGASSMTVEIAPSAGKWCGIYAYIFDPDGIKHKTLPRINPEKGDPVKYTISEKLTPGVWEVIPFAYHNLTKTSTYDLHVSFGGIAVQTDDLAELDFANGELPGGKITATDNFGHFSGTASGSLNGWQKKETTTISDDKYELSFKVGKEIKSVQFDLAISKETWNLFTDVAANIADSDGKYLVSGGFQNRETTIHFTPPQPGEYTLQVVAAFADPAKKKEEWRLDVRQVFESRNPVNISVIRNDKDNFELYPGIPAALQFQLSEAPRILPNGFSYFGRIAFTDKISKTVVAEIPVDF